MDTEHKSDKVVSSVEVRSTLDYTKFKTMAGNRAVDKSHVKMLQKLMLENGNLTYEFPIVVDEEGNVIDGQHRLEALISLGWEVGYIVERSATIDTVRAINRGNRNWSWRDVANSHANLGNEHYKWFLNFVDTYNLNFSPALEMAGGKMNRMKYSGSTFYGGGFEVKDKAKSHTLAKQVTEIQDIIENFSGDLAFALINIMRSPEYSHDRMVQKVKAMGDKVPMKAKRTDFMRTLEELYNWGYPEDNRTRLF